MSSQQNQSGFAYLGIAAVVLIVAIFASLGFIFCKNFIGVKNTTKVNTSACSGNRAVDNWTKLENQYYTMPIPDGWNIKKYLPASDGMSMIVYSDYRHDNSNAGSLAYCNGTPATIETVTERSGNPDTNFNISIQKRENAQSMDDPSYDQAYKNLGYEILEPLKTKGGLTVHRYYRHYDKSPNSTYSGTQIIDNTDYYYYEVYIGDGNVLRLLYCIIPGQPNNLSQLNQAVQSIIPLI